MKRKGYIDGRIDHGYILKKIALFKDYPKRIPRGKAIKNGKKVKILKDYGSYLLIRRFFKKGYVKTKFVREI